MEHRVKQIGIVTWFDTPNYGTTLQAYALFRILRELGYAPCLIKRFQDPTSLRAVKDNLNALLGIRRFWKYRPDPCPAKKRAIHRFCKEELTVRSVVTKRDLDRLLKETSLFVCGSDQLWNCHDHFRPFEFLAFAGDVRRISYATSLGARDIPPALEEPVREYLSRFERISVRESHSVELLSRLLGRDDIRRADDPTFLLTARQWRQMAQRSAILPPQEPYLLCYLLKQDSEYPAVIDRLARENGIGSIVIVPSGENPSLRIPGADIVQAGIREFVRLVDGAALVCTDSFHGIALSVNLSKDFIAFRRFCDRAPGSQNQRLYDLFDRLGLGNRFYADGPMAPIDYVTIQKRTAALREASLHFLKEALG